MLQVSIYLDDNVDILAGHGIRAIEIDLPGSQAATHKLRQATSDFTICTPQAIAFTACTIQHNGSSVFSSILSGNIIRSRCRLPNLSLPVWAGKRVKATHVPASLPEPTELSVDPSQEVRHSA
jgi:hypothetical protein